MKTKDCYETHTACNGQSCSKLDEMIGNLINGNLKDAKRQAKRFSEGDIRFHLIDSGWTNVKAIVTASYLKGYADWQTYCAAT